MCNFRMRKDVEADLGSGSSQVRPLVGASSMADQGQGLLGVPFEVPLVPFPSLKLAKEYTEDISVKKEVPHNIETGVALPTLLENQQLQEPVNPKRPVGRPRLHPKKVVDPNRVKRVAKGDKPLGRPRTSHLKPPIVKRPRGRPRKDISKEIFGEPLDEETKSALTEDWRNSMSNVEAEELPDTFYNNSNLGSYNSSSNSSSNSDISHHDLTNISNVAALCADMYEASFVSQPITKPLSIQVVEPLAPTQGVSWAEADSPDTHS